jgi:hypothetical protein
MCLAFAGEFQHYCAPQPDPAMRQRTEAIAAAERVAGTRLALLAGLLLLPLLLLLIGP